MSPGITRITVLGPRRQVDLAVPDDVAVAELVPEIVGMVGGPPDGDLEGWTLGRLSGQETPGELNLREAGIHDGAVLVLRHRAHAPAQLIGLDVVDSATESADAARGRWSPSARRVFLLSCIAVSLVATAGLLYLARDQAGAPAAALAFPVAVTLAAVLAGTRDRAAGAVVGLAGTAGWAVAATVLFEASGRVVPAVAIGGLAVGGAVTLFAVPAARAAALALALTGTVATLAWLAALRLADASVAGSVAVLLVAALPVLPNIALRLSAVGPGMDTAGTDVGPRLASARVLLVALIVGCSALIVAAAVVLALADGVFPQVLCGLVGAAAVLRSRAFRFTAEVVPVAAAGGLALGVLDVAVTADALSRGSWLVAGAFVLAPAVLLLAPTFLGPYLDTQTLPRSLHWAEVGATLALIPVLIGVLGGYEALADAAARLR